MTTATSYWDFSQPTWVLVAGGVLVLACVWLSFRNIARNWSDKRFVPLELLRLVVVGLLMFTLFRPERVHMTSKAVRPLVAVLCDASLSMTTRDVVASDAEEPETRAQWLSTARDKKFWAPLEKRYDVVLEEFSPPPTPTTSTATPPSVGTNTNAVAAAATEPTQPYGNDEDHGTDLDLALEKALNYDRLRAVLLLSDGDWNKGRPPLAAATKLRLRGIPVFTVTVGSDRHLPDLDLEKVSAPAYGLMVERVSLPFTVQSRMPRDVKTTIVLRGPSGVEASKDIVIPAMRRIQSSVMLRPKTPGDFRFTMKLPIEKDELFKDNNEKSFSMSLRRELLKVLVVESRPRWEYRFLRNALSRDPAVVVRCLLLHSEMGPGEGAGYISSFPETKEELSQYDVVFLGDVGVGDGELTEKNVEMLKGLVEQQGSGLVFLPGGLGRQMTLMSTAIGSLMPVLIDEAKPRGSGFSIESKLSLTSRGRGHLLTMLATDVSVDQGIWRRLPGFYWHAPVVRSRMGSEVLAVHSVARNQHGRLPLLVTRECGNGKTLFMGTDAAWRWRKGVEDVYHYRFWGQVVRWMAHQRHLAHEEGIRFFFSPESPQKGSRVFLHATVFDKSGYPVKQGTVTATISIAGKRREDVTLMAEKGEWGVFTGSFVPREDGDHQLLIKCAEAGREVKSQISVASPKRERIGLPARARVLREIASRTGGSSAEGKDLKEIVAAIDELPEARSVQERFRLWCHPLWAALVVGLFGLYWTGRKLIGMV